jgi:chromosome segregation ATPase
MSLRDRLSQLITNAENRDAVLDNLLQIIEEEISKRLDAFDGMISNFNNAVNESLALQKSQNDAIQSKLEQVERQDEERTQEFEKTVNVFHDMIELLRKERESQSEAYREYLERTNELSERIETYNGMIHDLNLRIAKFMETIAGLKKQGVEIRFGGN